MVDDLESPFGADVDSDPPGAEDPRSAKKAAGRSKRAAEDVLADAFAEAHHGRLRYVSFWNRWLEWDGTRWATDATRHAYDLVRARCKEIGMTASAKTINAAHTFAQADRRLAETPDEWDRDPDVFNQDDDQ